jgi:putative toxin-antitoxin system antitoxin component (TIGR02293 family)
VEKILCFKEKILCLYMGTEKTKKTSSSKTELKPYKPDETISMVSDFLVPYQTRYNYSDDVSLLNRSKKGLDAKSALDFLSLSGFTQDEFQDTFKTTVKTIQNHVNRALTLDSSLSEKLLKSFALFDKGIELFGSAKAFHQWLMVPAYGLGHQLPYNLMDTITGIQLIEEELIRIEYGALA